MFYYYEKDKKILASERNDLPYAQGEPTPGAPIYYLVEGDPVLGRGSFKVNHPGQLKAPHGLEVLDASRLPEFPLDGPLSAALREKGGAVEQDGIGRIHFLTIQNTGIEPAQRGVGFVKFLCRGHEYNLQKKVGTCIASLIHTV